VETDEEARGSPRTLSSPNTHNITQSVGLESHKGLGLRKLGHEPGPLAGLVGLDLAGFTIPSPPLSRALGTYQTEFPLLSLTVSNSLLHVKWSKPPSISCASGTLVRSRAKKTSFFPILARAVPHSPPTNPAVLPIHQLKGMRMAIVDSLVSGAEIELVSLQATVTDVFLCSYLDSKL